MTTAEANNERATVGDFSEVIATAVNDARAAGMPEHLIARTLSEYAESSAELAAKEAG